MRIVGHGIDIIEIARIARMVDDHGERFLRRCFTADECLYAVDKARRIEHLAGRFAAKEAIFKALGTGLSDGIGWTDAEVRRDPTGQPRVTLRGRAAEIAGRRRINQWWLSISHIKTHAVASAIAVDTLTGE